MGRAACGRGASCRRVARRCRSLMAGSGWPRRSRRRPPDPGAKRARGARPVVTGSPPPPGGRAEARRSGPAAVPLAAISLSITSGSRFGAAPPGEAGAVGERPRASGRQPARVAPPLRARATGSSPRLRLVVSRMASAAGSILFVVLLVCSAWWRAGSPRRRSAEGLPAPGAQSPASPESGASAGRHSRRSATSSPVLHRRPPVDSRLLSISGRDRRGGPAVRQPGLLVSGYRFMLQRLACPRSRRSTPRNDAARRRACSALPPGRR